MEDSKVICNDHEVSKKECIKIIQEETNTEIHGYKCGQTQMQELEIPVALLDLVTNEEE